MASFSWATANIFFFINTGKKGFEELSTQRKVDLDKPIKGVIKQRYTKQGHFLIETIRVYIYIYIEWWLRVIVSSQQNLLLRSSE